MDSNSSSYLILLFTIVLLTIVVAFFNGLKRKTKKPPFIQKEDESPFELKTTHITQLLIYLWFPVLISIPIFVFKSVNSSSYWVMLLVLMVVFFSWFIAAQGILRKDHHEEK